jgi:KH/beta-lactamase-domain protein
MEDVISEIKKHLPPDAMITDTLYEGANIVLYTKNQNFIFESKELIKDIVDKIKKRVEIRPDPSILLDMEHAEEQIRKTVPEEAGVGDIWFDYKRSIVFVEAAKPGLVIGKGGKIINDIRKKTLWIPVIRRAPAIKSDIVKSIRTTLFKNSEYRRNFLNKIGEKIYQPFERDQKYWIRLSCLGGFREVGRSCLFLQTPFSKVLLDCGVNIASEIHAFPYLEVPEFNIKDLDAVVITHSHLDHCGFAPYLYRFGYRGPIYCTEPTRDVMTILQLDYTDITQKEGRKAVYSSKDVHEMIKHTVCLEYNEVTDLTRDVRLTLHNAGHILGSAMAHLNIGNGYHNMLYTSDFKYAKSMLFDKALDDFQRLETLIIESTYGAKEDIKPKKEEAEKDFLSTIKKTIKRKGKVLVPVLGVGRAQELILILEDAVRKKKIPKVPIIIDGMVWDVTAIHTTYPEFMDASVRDLIFHRDHNPFLSEIFKRTASQKERDKIIEEKGPVIVLATAGMLTGGPSVYYLYQLAENPKNTLIFVSYQGEGSLGRRIQRGEKEIDIDVSGKSKKAKIKLETHTVEGFSGHSDRDQLVNFVKSIQPKPKRIIVNHGENSKTLALASFLHNLLRVETSAARDLDTLRIR